MVKHPPPSYDDVNSDDDSIPPPPPPMAEGEHESFHSHGSADIDHERTTSTKTAKPVKKWRLLKKEAEHALVPQDDPADTDDAAAAAATATASAGENGALIPSEGGDNNNVPMQGHFRGIHNAQEFDEEEAGMDDIEVPSSSVVNRLNRDETSDAKKRKFYKMGMLAGLAVVVLIAVVTGSVLGTRGGGGGGDSNVANAGDGNAEQDVGGGNDEQNVGGGNDNDNDVKVVPTNPNMQTAAGTFLLADPTIPDSVKASLDDPDSAGAQALAWVLNNPNFAFDDPASFLDEDVQFDFKQLLGAAAIGNAFNAGDGFASEEDVCEWEGIVCDGGGDNEGENRNLQDSIPANAITGIDMAEQGIEGTIPVEITLLKTLSQINMYSNKLQGPIPPELGSMPNLIGIDFYDNELTGEIPPELFSENVVGLYLSKNNLNGQLPDVSQMTRLQMIWLDDNDFTGPIPPEFGALSELETLLLSDNDFTGDIPPELGDLEALKVLNLSNCKLENEIPEELAGALSLEKLYLSGNFLEGEIPWSFEDLENLNTLEFEDNFNIYRVPDVVCALELEILLGGCQIQECGCCTDRCAQTAAEIFLLADPTISDSVKSSLYNPGTAGAQALEWFLNDPVNAEFPFDAASFEDEDVQFDFKQRLGAAALGFAFNLGDGFASEKDVCEWDGIACDGGGNAITIINMPEKKIEGTIPVEITLLNSLSQISLYSNEVYGPIPPELGSMPNLFGIDFYDNELTGEIPPELFSENMVGLYLSKNNLNGQLPDVSQMTQLKMIWLDDNDFTGPIPTEFGTLSELEMLLLADNDFTGGIPPELGDLEALKVLNLSNCDLTDEIPAQLADAFSLEELYLWGNFLQGDIPRLFQRLENLKTFEFQNNYIENVPDEVCGLGLDTLLGGCELQYCACCTDVCE